MAADTKLADLPSKWRQIADAPLNEGGPVSGGMRAGFRRCAYELEAALARQEPVCSGGFVISNGSGDKYIAWGQVGPKWVADRSDALWLVRRADAEALAAENEDAWLILPVERCARPPAGWVCTLASGHEGPCPTIAAPPAAQAVAYLDLGVGGYMDVGTDLDDGQLAQLPKGRHMLGIIGTYGVDGYVPAGREQRAAPAEQQEEK